MSKIAEALKFASEWSQFDGSHHKAWAIDQMIRILTDCPVDMVSGIRGESPEYREFVRIATEGEDGPNTYEWDTGIAP